MFEIMILGRIWQSSLGINNRLVVYKFMSKGNLYDHLFYAQNMFKAKITMGIAKGITWLDQDRIVCSILGLDLGYPTLRFAKFLESYFTSSNWRIFAKNEVWDLSSFKKDVCNLVFLLLELIAGKGISKIIDSPKCFKGDMIVWIFNFLFFKYHTICFRWYIELGIKYPNWRENVYKFHNCAIGRCLYF